MDTSIPNFKNNKLCKLSRFKNNRSRLTAAVVNCLMSSAPFAGRTFYFYSIRGSCCCLPGQPCCRSSFVISFRSCLANGTNCLLCFDCIAIPTSRLRRATAESQASATHSKKTSAGVFQRRHSLGRLLIRSSTNCTSSSVIVLKSKPFGKKNLTISLVFSFVPRCHGL